MESKVKIRRLHFVKGYSIKKLMRDFNLSRNTVRAIIRADKAESEYQRKDQPLPKLGEFKDILKLWLEDDFKLPRKQRRNAMRYYSQLLEKGYDGAYDSVQRYVKHWKIKHKESSNGAYIPLSFDPGEAYQFDWSEELVQIDGVDQKLKVAHFKLSYSRKFLVIAYFRESQEMLFDAHDRAFSYFGGVPLRGIFDNMKTAVDTVFVGKERVFNNRFLSLMDHYLIEPTACNPAAGWEKGQVEKQVDIIRNWIFLPKLKVKSIDELNSYLLKRSTELSIERKHPEIKDKTFEEMYQIEKSKMRPHHNLFNGYGDKSCKVSSICLIAFDRNHYSVESTYANKTVSVKSFPNKIEIICDGENIGIHTRYFCRNKTTFNPFHYLPILERKPGALRNGTPFKEWKLPDAITSVKSKLMKRKGGDRECVEILSAIREQGLDAVNVACELALEDKIVTRDYILNALNRLRDNSKPEQISIPLHLELEVEPNVNCEQYNQLLEQTHVES